MDEPRIEQLQLSLEQNREELLALRAELGRRRRRGRAVAVAAVAVGAALLVTGQASPPDKLVRAEIVQAERLILAKDEKIHGELTLRGTSPRLALYDGTSRGRITMAVAESGTPSIALSDDAGKIRMGLGVSRGGNPSVTLHDADQRVRAAVALAKDGSAQVSLSDEAGERRLSITLTGDGIPSVMLGDGTRNRVAIGVSEKGLPTFNFRDAEGRTRTLFAILEDGQPVLQFKDAENNVLQQLPAPK